MSSQSLADSPARELATKSTTGVYTYVWLTADLKAYSGINGHEKELLSKPYTNPYTEKSEFFSRIRRLMRHEEMKLALVSIYDVLPQPT